MASLETLRPVIETQDDLRKGPPLVRAIAYNDAQCTDDTMRDRLYGHLATELVTHIEHLGRRGYAGVVLPEHVIKTPFSVPADPGTWPECLRASGGIVPIVHQATDAPRDDKNWYHDMRYELGVRAVETRREFDVNQFPSQHVGEKLDELSTVARRSQLGELLPIVGIVINRNGNHSGARCRDVTEEAIDGLRKRFESDGVFEDLVGVQISVVTDGKSFDRDELVDEDLAAQMTGGALRRGMPLQTQIIGIAPHDVKEDFVIGVCSKLKRLIQDYRNRKLLQIYPYRPGVMRQIEQPEGESAS